MDEDYLKYAKVCYYNGDNIQAQAAALIAIAEQLQRIADHFESQDANRMTQDEQVEYDLRAHHGGI